MNSKEYELFSLSISRERVKSFVLTVVMIILLVLGILVGPVQAGDGTDEMVVQGGLYATNADAVATSETAVMGDGAWLATPGEDSNGDGNDKFNKYLYWNDGSGGYMDITYNLGSFVIDDIASISYQTNKPAAQDQPDFYLLIYTLPDGSDDHSWYGYRLNAEPYFSENLNATVDQWNQWTTDATTNQLTFFDSWKSGTYGFYGQPTLQDLQSGSINWQVDYGQGVDQAIDYGAEQVMALNISTGSDWSGSFEGYLDAVIIELNDGTRLTFDLENEVWVDDDYDSSTQGWDQDHFDTIQEGVDAITHGGTVHVLAGTYTETVTIDKSVTLTSDTGDYATSGTIISGTLDWGVDAPDVTIQGFRFENVSPTNGVITGNDNNLTLISNSFLNADKKAVFCYTPGVQSGWIITGNHISGVTGASESGLFLDGLADSVIAHNEIEDTAYAGMILSGVEGLHIHHNIIHNTPRKGIQVSNSPADPKETLIEYNAITNTVTTDDDDEGAISLYADTHNVTIRHNQLTNNYRGLVVRHLETDVVSGIHVHYNNISNNRAATGLIDDPSDYQGGTLDARMNWWGDATGPGDEGPGSGDAVTTNVIYCPWLDATDGNPTSDDGLVTNLDTGEAFCAIQPAIDDSDTDDGDTIEASAGTYTETIVIDKELTLRGATYDVNKNGYMVPAAYAWDDTVESIISNPGLNEYYVVDIVDANNVTFEGFIVQSVNTPGADSTQHLLRVNADNQTLNNIVVRNNIIGPNTNINDQPGNRGRMGLYLATPGYGGYGLTNSLFAGNKIFDCKGNGNNVFVWGAASNYHALGNSDYTGTVIEDNEIYGSHRSGIEIAGGVDNLTIRDNVIRDNSGLTGEESNLKYGNGILVIRTSGDKVTGDAYGPDHLTIANNTIYSNEKNGIYMGPINTNHVITGNIITDNDWDGVRIDLEESYHSDQTPVYTRTEQIALNNNEIVNNGHGARVIGAPQNGFALDARMNWWGDATGPGDAGPGTGDAVSANVIYCPWLDASEGDPLSDRGLVTNLDTGEAFCAIQPAIDDSDTDDGDTLSVSAGTYTETVTIDKALILQGEDQATTIIDGTGTTPAPLITANDMAGEVTIDGFTLQNAQPYGGYDQRVCVVANGGKPGSVLTMTNNTLIGGITDPSQRDFGLIMQNTETELVFTHNTVNNFYWHGILHENALGSSEIAWNDVTVYPDRYASFTAHLAYESGGNMNHVTTLQSVHDNIIDANGGSGIVFISAIGLTSYNERTGGIFSNVHIADNVITDVGGKGIQLEMDGDGGGFVDTVISGNTLVGRTGTAYTTRGIRTLATVTDTLVVNNTITGFDQGFYQSYSWGQPGAVPPTGTTLRHNSIVSNVTAIANEYAATSLINAEDNWFGCSYGPGATGSGCIGTTNPISDNIDAEPWLVLDLAATPMSVFANGGTADLLASLTENSNGQDTSAAGYVPDGIITTFAADLGNVSPVITSTVNGEATSLYTAPANPAGEVISATVHNQTVTLTLTIDQVDLQLSKTDGVIKAIAGEALTYTLTVTNAGGFNATGVELTDTLPVPVQFVSASHGGFETSGIVTWPTFNVAAGETVTRTVVVTINDPLPDGITNLINDAEVHDDGSHGPDATIADNTASDTTSVSRSTYFVYVPLVMNNYVSAPDLVVEDVNVDDSLEVVIANQGTAPVNNAFWVDLYINPTSPPTGVNQIWQEFCEQGIVWGVTETMNIGEVITLTLDSPYYSETYSQFTGDLPAGATLYAQVDSAFVGRTHGGVQELHEIQGTAYNNILGPVTVTTSCAATLEPNASPTSGVMLERLPRR